MNPITKFFHELMNPHCLHCSELRQQEIEQQQLDKEENSHCNVCEILQMELAIANRRIDSLLDKDSQKNENPYPVQTGTQKVLNTGGHIPFSVVRNRLETASKLKAAENREAQIAKTKAATPDVIEELGSVKDFVGSLKDIEKLEQSIGIEYAGNETETINS